MVDVELERALHAALGSGDSPAPPPRLAAAIAHAVFPGGARVRPRLCLLVARACDPRSVRVETSRELAYAAACAVELLHCASLVHDDLPCFDASPTRRGRPSVHHAYGEATAVLVGDGLMVQSFETLARAASRAPGTSPQMLVTLLGAASARGGLVGGQAWELEDEVEVAVYHRAKTASLFEAAAALGALVAGEVAVPFAVFGRAFGMAYQMADDVADVLGDSAKLGKPTARDRELGRPSGVPENDSVSEALARLAQASEAAADAVPSCAGAGDLRRFVEGVFDALTVRLRSAHSESPAEPASVRARLPSPHFDSEMGR